jgi:hypothetical protein
VDASPDVYTKDALLDMKHAHEQRVREAQITSERFQEIGEAALYDSGCAGRATNVWRFGDTVVVVDSYGSPPLRLPKGRWRASGVCFRQIHTSKGAFTIFDSSEANPDIEYWPDETTINIIQETYLFDEERLAPFAHHIYDITRVPAESTVKILVTPDESLVGHIESVKKQIDSISRDNYLGVLDDFLFKLWRAGLSEPDRVCKLFRNYRGVWWYDGSMAGWVEAMARELDLVKKATASD